MKAVFAGNSSKVEVKDVNTGKVGSGDVLVGMKACGICGSDLEKVYGTYAKPSMRLGHEPAGVVLGVGSDVKDVSVGDRVFTHHHVECGVCRLCLHGNETLCEKYSASNLDPCGLADEYIVPEWNVLRGGLLKIPDGMSFSEAAMIEPLACCMRSWEKVKYEPGDTAAIFGAGTTGILHVMLAKYFRLDKILCTDTNSFRLDFAKSVGADYIYDASDDDTVSKMIKDTSDIGVDVSVVATSNLLALQNAIDVTRKGGTGHDVWRARKECDNGFGYE